MKYQSTSNLLEEICQRLLGHYGPQGWWPGETPFEVMVGAILTQAATWGNVERAIANLKGAGALSPKALGQMPLDELARLVRPSGYFNAKAAKLKALALFLGAYGDDLERLFSLPLPRLRQELLAVHGIGEETADSILLYAGGKVVFVVDAYTRRIFSRLCLGPGGNSYKKWQAYFQGNLPPRPDLFNEYHALLVRHGKELCRSTPICTPCPLLDLCQHAKRLYQDHQKTPQTHN